MANTRTRVIAYIHNTYTKSEIGISRQYLTYIYFLF